MPSHKDATNDDMHKIGVTASSDPGAIGAGKVWHDTDDDTIKIRNTADSGWLTVYPASGSLTDHTHAVTGSGATGGGATVQPVVDHIADASAAHAASAISILDTAADFTATDVEGALAELQADAEAHLADAAGAHAASAISFTPNGSIAATDVQAAIQEVRDEAGATIKGFHGTCSGQSIANATDDAIEWTEVQDTDGWHTGTANAIVVGHTGWYSISASVDFSSGGTTRELRIKNGSTDIAWGSNSTNSTQRAVTYIGYLTAADSITIVAYANAAGVTASGQVGVIYLGA